MKTTLSKALIIVVGLWSLTGCKRTQPQTQTRLTYVKVQRVRGGALPRRDPMSALWNQTPEHEARLMVQNVTPPMLATPGVERVRVRALHDNQWISFRLEWTDATQDDILGPSRFSDGAAVQFPRRRGTDPSPFMGGPGAPVTLLYWKAAWQRGDSFAALYPNRPPTTYPFDPVQGAAHDQMARQYSPALAVSNPNLVRPNNSPVYVGEAEGFGSLSPHPSRESDGLGVYSSGHWYTVLSVPIGDQATSTVAPGQRTSVAFAVWNGSAQETGSRKMRTEGWIRLVIEEGR